MTPAQRRLRSQLAAATLHARYDSRQLTAPARRAFLARFEAQVDPERRLPSAERQRRAASARRAYFVRLALASSRARAKRRGHRAR